jgi:hypothetical protein
LSAAELGFEPEGNILFHSFTDAKTAINDLKTIDEMFENLKNSEQTKDIQKKISDLHQLRNETIESLNGLYVEIQRLAYKKNKMIRRLKENSQKYDIIIKDDIIYSLITIKYLRLLIKNKLIVFHQAA